MPLAWLRARLAPTADWRRPGPFERIVAAGLALGIAVLVLLALLGIAARTEPPLRPAPPTLTFDLPAPSADREKTTRTKPTPTATTAPPAPAKRAKVVPPAPPVITPNMVVVSPEDFAAMDIGKLPVRGGTASGAGRTGHYGPGEGPGGAQLYPAEWYERPPRGALAAYLPAEVPPGSWAEIACRTAPRYHVENCIGLGQSRPGLSAALRQAAWQFLVVPPRVDGKPLIGVWVRIHFDFTQKE